MLNSVKYFLALRGPGGGGGGGEHRAHPPSHPPPPPPPPPHACVVIRTSIRCTYLLRSFASPFGRAIATIVAIRNRPRALTANDLVTTPTSLDPTSKCAWADLPTCRRSEYKISRVFWRRFQKALERSFLATYTYTCGNSATL